jgi:hypothetical protein
MTFVADRAEAQIQEEKRDLGPDHLTGYRTNLKGSVLLHNHLNETVVKDVWDRISAGAADKQIADPRPGQSIVADRTARDFEARAYAGQVEDAFLKFKGDMPLSWILEQEPDDLALLDVEAGRVLRQTQIQADWHRTQQARREQDLHERTMAQIKSQEIWRTAIGIGAQWDGKMPEEHYTSVRAEIEKEMDNPDTFWGDLMDFAWRATGAATASDALNAIPGWEDVSIIGAIPALGKPLSQYLTAEHEEDYQRRRAELDTLVPEEVGREAMNVSMEEFWAEMVEDGRADEWVQMGMGDMSLGFGLFSAAWEESVPEPNQQISQLGEEIKSNMTMVLEENNYGPGAEVLDALSLWGRGVMIAPTGLALLLTDEDLRSDVLTGEVTKLWDGIVENDFSPAEVLGLGGTAVGLALDIGAGIVFDPTTWVFGPTAAAAGQRARTAAEVAQEVGSIGVQRTIDDVMRLYAAGDTSTLTHLTGFMDDVGGTERLWMAAKNQPYEAADDLKVLVRDRTVLKADKTPGHSGDLVSLFKSYQSGPKSEGLRAVTINKEAVQHRGLVLMRTTDDLGDKTAAVYVWVDDAGEIQGGTRWIQGGDNAQWWTADPYRGRDIQLQSRTIDAIRDGHSTNAQIEDLLRVSASDTSITEAGAKAVQRELDRYVTESSGLTRDKVQQIFEESMLSGARVPAADRLPLNIEWNSRVKASARNGKIEDMERWLGARQTTVRYDYTGPGAYARIMESVDQVWGSNRVKAQEWADRMMGTRRKLAESKAARVADSDFIEHRAVTQAIEESRNMLGDSHYSTLRAGVDDGGQAADNIAQLQRTMTDLEKTKTQLAAKLAAKYPKVDSYDEVGKAMLDMWDDYNRTVLAEMPGWKKHVGEDGLVPWDVLRGGRESGEQATETALRSYFDDQRISVLGAEGEEMIQTLSGVLNREMGVHVPVSPLDLVIASSASGAKYQKVMQQQVMSRLRENAFNLHRLWVIDKVFRPATAATVSFDELSRIFHRYGMKSATRYLDDKVMGVGARASRVLRIHGDSLPKRMRERATRLSEYPMQYKSAERQTFENMGTKWDNIAPGDPNYVDAARRWSGNLLQDKGFQAALRGEDAFRAFWADDAGRSMRMQTVRDGQGARLMTFEEAWDGWNTVMDYVFSEAKKVGRYDEVRMAFRDTARVIEDTGGMRELPDWVIQDKLLGTVRGARRQTPGGVTGTMMSAQELFFEKLFMDPTNYRRGFIHDLAYNVEMERLLTLQADRGIRVATDHEIARALGLGDGSQARLSYGNMLDELAGRNGMTSRKRLEDLAENHAANEIDSMMYAWDSASRFGRQAKFAVPFGGPWADMWAFWGREMMTRPALRGWINDANFLNIGEHARQMTSVLPFNPRVPAMVSRLSNTDFDIDRGWIPETDGEGNPIDQGEGLLPGSSSTSLGPLFFLPTGGDNPFSSIVPGMGFVPTELLDLLITQQFDPIDDAEGYENLLGQVSQIIPGMSYTRGNIIADVVGGGSIGTAVGSVTDAIAWQTGKPFYELGQYMGDISQDIGVTREVSAIMADPETLAELLTIQDEEALEVVIAGIADEAARTASGQHLAGRLTRWVVPAKSDFDTALDEIYDVWIQAGNQFPDIASSSPIDRIDGATADERRRLGDDVRRNFFDLPQWKRDLYIAQYPQLAVNLVASWEWTRRGEVDMGRDATVTYRVEATNEGMARHQQYIHDGYIRPVAPLARVYQTVGLIHDTRRRVAKDIYTQTAASINDLIWEKMVPPVDKVNMESWLNTEVDGRTYGERMGVTDVRALWEQWGSVEGGVEEFVAASIGHDMETPAVESAIKDLIKIKDLTKAWGTSFPGLGNASERYRDWTFEEFPEAVEEMAAGMGLDLTPGMTGEQLFTGIEELLTENESPLWDLARAPYLRYQGERSVAGTAAFERMSERTHDEDLNPEWRQDLREFITFSENVGERIRDLAGALGTQQGGAFILREEIMEVRQRFGELQMTGDDANMAWERIWKEGFERTYGPLDWESPQPPTLFDEEGGLNSDAYAPIFNRIIDGDTVVVTPSTQGMLLGLGDNAGPRHQRSVRLLGVRARELSSDPQGGAEDKIALLDAIQAGVDTGENIYLVRDTRLTGGRNTDSFGRELAWLFIGQEAYWDPNSFLPGD